MSTDGVFADAELEAYMSSAAANPPSPRTVPIAQSRALRSARGAVQPPGPTLFSIDDLTLDTPVPLPARLYRPADEPRPMFVFFHGGGWVTGSLDTHDPACRRFATIGGVTVLSVEYRLAPEHPWPAAVDDAIAATRFALEHGDELGGSGPVGVAGSSAGGNLAALAAIELGDALAAQALIYPATDLTFSLPSTVEKATGFGLGTDACRFYVEQWVPDPGLRADPRVSPLFANDLSHCAPAVVVVAEHDPLRDEGAAYADRLRADGVTVEFWNERGLVHGFLGLDAISPAAKAAGDRIFAAAAELIGRR